MFSGHVFDVGTSRFVEHQVKIAHQAKCPCCQTVIDIPYFQCEDRSRHKQLPIENNILKLYDDNSTTTYVCLDCYNFICDWDTVFRRSWIGKRISGGFIPGMCM